MKKINSFCQILVVVMTLLMLASCRQRQASKPYQLAIFDKNQIKTFMISGSSLKPVETIKRTETKTFDKESFKAFGNQYVTKTLEGTGLNVYLERIDKKTLTEAIRPAPGNDAYTSIVDNQYFYTTAVFTDRIDFYKFDNQLKKVLHQKIPNNEYLNASNQFLIIDDHLYLLVSYVDKNTQKPGTSLWKMDKAFNLIETIDLEDESAYLRMVNVGHKLYLPETFAGRLPNGEPKSGNRIMVFDLDKREKYYLPSSIKYPKSIYYQESTNQLVIENDGFYNKNFPWTTHDLSTHVEQTIIHEMPKGKEYSPPFFAKNDTSYYFLFSDYLIVYDCQSGQKTSISLSEFKIDSAHAMISSDS
ncbi:TPA: hypothetical protein VB410_001653 [Streptococcus pyogenes]|uniref:hypothetical protein n=1 Tax=Streptococcus pyogenes TaxID=1314 RepID=UPI00109BED79|nr:hypothetical protein [Streptococcus pyogenes]HER4652029.1 hypothetical protein [Streptococcus pyogenes NGAS505]QCK29364.1 hypothetical protein ETT71_08200 [Streptococcus pyogenes]QCK34484.1 hypothetical protein ETT68_08080 [Streptococcus pyogenes]QCK69847.1 hypothetical protein ETT47_07825 [Streptococcus pyogenes]HEP1274897.1 hypothetical protein [Streptococcus pyogenes]